MRTSLLFLSLFLLICINSSAQAPNDYSFKKSYPLSTPATISVSTNDGFIHMNASQSDQIEIYFIVKKDNRVQNIDLDELMEELEVDIVSERDHFELMIRPGDSKKLMIWKDRYNVSLQINAPRNSSNTLKTSDGNIRLADFNGEQNCKTSDGDVSVENIEGNLIAHTSDGNIHAEDIEGNTELRTSDGDINAENIDGELNCRTSDGNISIEQISRGVDAITSDGDIFLDQTRGKNSAQTSDGNIHFEDLQGSLSARTSDGDIRGNINKLTDDLFLKTSDGDISVTIPDGMGIDLSVKGEKINTKLEHFSGDTGDHRINGKIRGGGITVDLSTSDGIITLNYK